MSTVTLSTPISSGIPARPEAHGRATPAEAPGRNAGAEARGSDRVDLSEQARRLGETRSEISAVEETPIRLDLVQRVRESIARGDYESPVKLAIAADGLARSAIDVKG